MHAKNSKTEKEKGKEKELKNDVEYKIHNKYSMMK
jgi:hypothetical protein